ncbi:MAG: methyltransferase domain-containing protein [Saprospiraceae bacterium]|nr:methyltransferase domain-containing protein [Saprospiraceae bacterium]
MPTNNDLTVDFWETRWQNGQTGWDLGAPSPALSTYLDQIPPAQRHLRVLLPGCGNGHEALDLLQKGFSDITMLDIAPTAVERLRQRLDAEAPGWENRLRVVCADFFEIEGPFDLILEQTFFCALPPALREDYVRKMHELLAPGGKLAGLLFDRHFDGGPPFGGSQDEYVGLFQPSFHLKTLEPCYHSIAPRAGSEVFFIFEKK